MAIAETFKNIEKQIRSPLPGDLKCVSATYRIYGPDDENDADALLKFDEQIGSVIDCLGLIGYASYSGHRLRLIVIKSKSWSADIHSEFRWANSLNDPEIKVFDSLEHLFEGKTLAVLDDGEEDPTPSDWDKWLAKAAATPEDFEKFARLSEMCGGDAMSMWSILDKAEKIKNREPTPFLIPGLLPRAQLTMLAGQRKIGKSSLAKSLCVAVPNEEEEWLGFPLNIIKNQLVLYLFGEGSEEENDRSITRMNHGEWPWRLIAVRANGKDIDTYLKDFKSHKVGLLVVDPDRSFYQGKENESDEADAFCVKINNFLHDRNCAGITLHHLTDRAEPRTLADVARAIRGSGVWGDRPRVTWALTRDEFGIPAPGGIARHNFLDSEMFMGVVRLGWDAKIGRHILKGKAKEKAADPSMAVLDRVLRAIEEQTDKGKPVKRTGKSGLFELGLSELSDLTRGEVRDALDRLRDDGRLATAEDGSILPK
jgi:hypothetical protein